MSSSRPVCYLLKRTRLLGLQGAKTISSLFQHQIITVDKYNNLHVFDVNSMQEVDRPVRMPASEISDITGLPSGDVVCGVPEKKGFFFNCKTHQPTTIDYHQARSVLIIGDDAFLVESQKNSHHQLNKYQSSSLDVVEIGKNNYISFAVVNKNEIIASDLGGNIDFVGRYYSNYNIDGNSYIAYPAMLIFNQNQLCLGNDKTIAIFQISKNIQQRPKLEKKILANTPVPIGRLFYSPKMNLIISGGAFAWSTPHHTKICFWNPNTLEPQIFDFKKIFNKIVLLNDDKIAIQFIDGSVTLYEFCKVEALLKLLSNNDNLKKINHSILQMIVDYAIELTLSEPEKDDFTESAETVVETIPQHDDFTELAELVAETTPQLGPLLINNIVSYLNRFSSSSRYAATLFRSIEPASVADTTKHVKKSTLGAPRLT